MTKMKVILNCLNCDYFIHALKAPKPQCWHGEEVGRVIDFLDTIPSWCPLPDVPTKEEENP